MDIRKS